MHAHTHIRTELESDHACTRTQAVNCEQFTTQHNTKKTFAYIHTHTHTHTQICAHITGGNMFFRKRQRRQSRVGEGLRRGLRGLQTAANQGPRKLPRPHIQTTVHRSQGWRFPSRTAQPGVRARGAHVLSKALDCARTFLGCERQRRSS